VLYDDRDESVGVKLNDADLIGIPLQIIVGNKSLINGELEIKVRRTNEKFNIKIENFQQELKNILERID
jgi:prolyl-tRNA synthetase